MALDEINEFKYTPMIRSVDEICSLYDRGRLNLSPGFQRKSVWKDNDRKKLIDSILRGFPLPAIFLYQRKDENTGENIFDVIDGKQRLESIFLFLKDKYSVKIGDETVLYKNLVSQKKQGIIKNYNLNIVFVEGDFDAIIELFVRINSTGKALSKEECSKAQYYQSKFLKAAYALSKSLNKKFKENNVFSDNDISRMKDIGFLCDFMYAVYKNGVCDKKSARNNAFGDLTDNRSVEKTERESAAAIRKVFQMFPNIKTTRFNKISDFYCLCVLIYKYQTEKKFALDDQRKNIQAFELLKALSVGVAALKERKPNQHLNNDIYQAYSLTVQSATDSYNHRLERFEILDSLLGGIFEKKAEKRIFTPAQRMIIWHSSMDQACERCGKKLTWENFTVDHIKPYSKGGKTCIENAALMCQSCNSKKGNR